jgi:hypothetical protein
VLTGSDGNPQRQDDYPAGISAGGRYDTFVVRVFSPSRDEGMIHGEVTHVGSRQRLHFRDLHRVIEFIVARVGRHAASRGRTERT